MIKFVLKLLMFKILIGNSLGFADVHYVDLDFKSSVSHSEEICESLGDNIGIACVEKIDSKKLIRKNFLG